MGTKKKSYASAIIGDDERSGSGMSRGLRSESGVGAWDGRRAEHSRRASGLLERRLLREHATLLFITQLLYCHVVALIIVEKERREINSHNHLFIKNLRRKHGFPNFQKSPKP